MGSRHDRRLSDLASENEVVRPFGSMPLVPQTTRVDDKQKEKIRKNMYVHFRALVPHPKGKVPPTRFTINNGLFEEVANSEGLNIYSWIDAFVICMSVRLEFYVLNIYEAGLGNLLKILFPPAFSLTSPRPPHVT